MLFTEPTKCCDLLCNHFKIQGVSSKLHVCNVTEVLKCLFPEDSNIQMLGQLQKCLDKQEETNMSAKLYVTGHMGNSFFLYTLNMHMKGCTSILILLQSYQQAVPQLNGDFLYFLSCTFIQFLKAKTIILIYVCNYLRAK